MTDLAERFRRLETSFHRVRAMEVAERERALRAEEIADPDLASELRAMLAAHDADAPLVDPDALLESLRDLAAPGHPTIVGGYRIIRVVGEGGMGIIYEAEQRRPRRRVALKLVRPGLLIGASSAERVRRFAREVEALGRLEHPGIARVHEAGEAEVATASGVAHVHFVAMEFVDGAPLLEFADARRLDLRARVELMAQVCDAVAAAHAAGVVHRDLKQANILVTATGTAKVLDFGIARIVPGAEDGNKDGASLSLRTSPGELLGTLSAMAPEQFEGDPARVTARSDVYALGVLLFELLAGRAPLDLRTLPLAEAARVVRDEPPPRLGELAPHCRGDLETIVGKAIAKEPERRYRDAGALAADLRRWLRHEPIEARPPTAVYRITTFTRRHRTLVVATLAVIVMLLGSTVALAVFLYREHEHRARVEAANAELAREVYVATISAARSALRGGEYTTAARELGNADPALRGWEWRFLARQLAPVEFELAVLDAPIRTLDTSGDGRRIVAIDESGVGVVVDVATRSVLWRFEVSPGPATQVSVDARGERFLVRTPSAFLGFATGLGLVVRLEGDRTIADLAIAPDGETFLVSDLGGGVVRRHSFLDGEEVAPARDDGFYSHPFEREDGAVFAWNRAVNGVERLGGAIERRGAAGSSWGRTGRPVGMWASRAFGLLLHEQTLEAIDLATGASLGGVAGPFARDEGFAVAHDGRAAAITRASDATDVLWLEGDRIVPNGGAAAGYGRRVWGRAAAFAPVDDLLWTGAADGAIRAWRHEIPSLFAIRSLPFTLAIAADGETVAAARWGTIRRLSTRDGRLLWTNAAHRHEVIALAFSADGRRLASADARGHVQIMDAEDGTLLRRWRCGTRPIVLLAWLHDGRLLIASGTRNGVGERFVVDPTDADAPKAEPDGGVIGPVVVDAARGRSALGLRDGGVVWYRDGVVGAETSPPPPESRAPLDWLTIDERRARLVGGAGGHILVWPLDGPTGVEARIAGPAPLRSRGARLSGDGTRLAVGDRAGSISLFDGERLDLVATVEVPQLDAADLAWRKDDAIVVGGGPVLVAALETSAAPQEAERARRAIDLGAAVEALQRHRLGARAKEALEREPPRRGGSVEGMLRAIDELGDDALYLNSEAWALVRASIGGFATPTEADRMRAETGLAYAERAAALREHDHAILNTLALAQVRTHRPQEALATIDRCDALQAASGLPSDPFDIALRAAAHVLLDDRDSALAALRGAESSAGATSDADLRAFIEELRAAVGAMSGSSS